MMGVVQIVLGIWVLLLGLRATRVQRMANATSPGRPDDGRTLRLVALGLGPLLMIVGVVQLIV